MQLLAYVLAVPLLSVASLGQVRSDPEAQEVWHHADQGLKWTPHLVTLGNHATAVFCHPELNNTRSMLLSRHDVGPPTPIWEYVADPDQGSSTASASRADVHLAIVRTPTGVINQDEYRLRRYSTAGLEWSYLYPHLTAGHSFVGVSADGATIVALIGNPTTGDSDVLIFGPDSPVPVAQHTLAGTWILGGCLSEDGSTLAMQIDKTATVVDLSSWTTQLVETSWSNFGSAGIDLDGDGSLLAMGELASNKIRVWSRIAGVYSLIHTITWSEPGSASGVAVSEDGSTIAYGFKPPFFSRKVELAVFDVASGTVTASETLVSFGLWQLFLSSLDISADGEVIAFGFAGDQPLLFDELRLFTKHESVPFATFDLPGSPLAVDLSDDGTWLAVGSKSTHLEASGSGGRVSLYRIGAPDLLVTGKPSLGGSTVVSLVAPPGALAFVAASLGPLPVPIDLGPPGSLLVEPVGAVLAPLGVVPPGGIASSTKNLPSSPGLVGATAWLQGLHLNPTGLSTTAFPLVLLP